MVMGRAWSDWVSEISAKVFSLCLLSDVPNYLKGDKYHIHTFHGVSHYMNAVTHRCFFLANFKAGCELLSHTFLFPSKFPQCLFLSAKWVSWDLPENGTFMPSISCLFVTSFVDWSLPTNSARHISHHLPQELSNVHVDWYLAVTFIHGYTDWQCQTQESNLSRPVVSRWRH